MYHERTHLGEAVKFLSNYHKWVSSHYSAGHRSAYAARCVPGRQMDLCRGRSVHRYIRRVRDRPSDSGHCHLLVLLRTGGHISADSAWRSGYRHCQRTHCNHLRAENNTASAKHAPGKHFGISGRRYREADLVCLQIGSIGGTLGHPADAPHVPLPLWSIWNMDGTVPFRIRVL